MDLRRTHNIILVVNRKITIQPAIPIFQLKRIKYSQTKTILQLFIGFKQCYILENKTSPIRLPPKIPCSIEA